MVGVVVERDCELCAGVLRSRLCEEAGLEVVFAAFEPVELGASEVCGVLLLPARPLVPCAKSIEVERVISIKIKGSLRIGQECKFGSDDY